MKLLLVIFTRIATGALFSAAASDSAPIQIQILAPTNGASLRAHEPSELRADVVDLDGFISQVEFFADKKSFGFLRSPPFSFSFQAEALGQGPHFLSVTASDNRGNTA